MESTAQFRFFRFISLLICATILLQSTEARDSRRGYGGSLWSGPDIFLKGTYMEVAINPAGTIGSRPVMQTTTPPYGGSAIPSGYHPSTSLLGVVTDYDKDGNWNTKSGDFIMEGDEEQGFHLQWTGMDTQYFSQQPLQYDDLNTDAPTGCVDCNRGAIPNCFFGDCSCPAYMPYNYRCPYLRWDFKTVSFQQITSNPAIRHVRWIGKAIGAEWVVDNGDYMLIPNGEEITITKDIWFGVNDQFITEAIVMENTGNATLTNVAYMAHIIATPEATLSPVYNTPQDFYTYTSIPSQGSVSGTNRVYVQSRGPKKGITTAMGMINEDARAWFTDSQTWEAVPNDQGMRPYQAMMPYTQPKNPGPEVLGSSAIAVSLKTDSMAPGDQFKMNLFHAFSQSAIEQAFEVLEVVSCDGITYPPAQGPILDSCSVCGGSCFSGCDVCGVCGGTCDTWCDACGVCQGSCDTWCDDCGVCEGTNTTCGPTGCDGVVGSTVKYDKCGVCGGNCNTFCDKCGVCNGNNDCLGCDGVPNSGKAYDQCGVCGGTCGTFCDRCGVCNGNNSCVGCDGVANSGKKYDKCGVCDGSNKCLGCDGIPYSTVKYDACGVCGGGNVTCDYGCDGILHSTVKYDFCGVCGGNNTCTCAGPNGPSTYDACGVCGGNGTSCVCECLGDELLGYDLSELDMLIYRAEIDRYVRPTMHDVMDTLEDQLMEMLFSDVDNFADRLESYDTFRQCAMDTWDQLKYRFNL